MGLKPIEQSNRRVGKEGGWTGRRRNYLCRICRIKFQVDTSRAVPENDRLCPNCWEHTDCPICGHEVRHKPGVQIYCCQRVACLSEAVERGLIKQEDN